MQLLVYDDLVLQVFRPIHSTALELCLVSGAIRQVDDIEVGQIPELDGSTAAETGRRHRVLYKLWFGATRRRILLD